MLPFLNQLKVIATKIYLRNLKQKRLKEKPNIHEKRVLFERAAERFKGKNVKVGRKAANGIPCFFFESQNQNKISDNPIVIYLHGGAYITGSVHSHRTLCERICHYWQTNLLSVDYRLAPEYPFPAAADDAISAYLWLVAQYPNNKIIIAGDSAGGGLALALCRKLIEDEERKPDGLILFAPWADLTCSSAKMIAMAEKDIVLGRDEILAAAIMYAGQYSLTNPYISPLYANFKGFPPVFIQTGSKDLLLHDSERLYQKLLAEGVTAELDIWQNMWHVFQLFSMVQKADKALKKAGEFVKKLNSLKN